MTARPLPFSALLLGAALLLPPPSPAAPGTDPLGAMLAGEFAFQQGRAEPAAKQFLEAARRLRDPAVAEHAARVAMLAGDAALAREAFAFWRELSGPTPELLQGEAELALRNGDPGQAADALAALLAGGGDEHWQRAAQTLLGHGESVAAAAAMERLLEAGALPDLPDAWIGFADVASRLELGSLSARFVDAAATRYPQSPRVLLWRARNARQGGDTAAARAAVEAAVVRIEPDSGLRLAAAAELDALGDPKAAAALLSDGDQSGPVVASRLAYLARADDEAGMEALYAELRPDEGEAADIDDARRFLLGQLAELLERHEEALGWYSRVADPSRRPQAELRIAVLEDRLGRLDDALSRLARLQVSDSDDGEALRDAYLLEAELLLRHDRLDKAIAAYGRGLGIFEDDPELLYARALAFERADRIDAAEADLRRLVELDPDNADALNALGYTLADRTDRYEEARRYIEQALELKPDSAAIIDSLGWVLYRQGHREEALEQLRRAFEMQADPEIAAHYGEVLWQSGAREKAREVWEAGLAVDPENRALREAMERFGQ